MNKEEWSVFFQLKAKEIGKFFALVFLTILVGNFLYWLLMLIWEFTPCEFTGFWDYAIQRPIVGIVVILGPITVVVFTISGIYYWISENIKKSKKIVSMRHQKGESK